ncbi:MAG: type II toxin-antitoxin system VapC family toxin [Alphaproteobacteria bacterium]
MTGFVLDRSVTMSWCFQDEARPETDALLVHLRDEGAIVPPLWFWEVGNVLAAALRRGRTAAISVEGLLEVLAALPITADPDAAGQAWGATLRLARAEGLTVYDAAYLELAIRKGAGLATTDEKLRTAAQGLGVLVLP